MGFFKRKQPVAQPAMTAGGLEGQMKLAATAVNTISEAVLLIDSQEVVRLVNPAGLAMLGASKPEEVVGIKAGAILKFEEATGKEVVENAIAKALSGQGEKVESRDYILVGRGGQKRPVMATVNPTGTGEKILSLRDISRELKVESEQSDFISTASHEMRTPVASIEGYLGLALNPQTATIDERARRYLEEAHKSSQHLGRLFQDLLDVTKLDDQKIRAVLAPVNMTEAVKEMAEGQSVAMKAKKLRYRFGTEGMGGDERKIEQMVYSSVDVDFLREIMNNLVENAIKYTKEGGEIWVNVRGDGDRVLINVTDTGIGIAPDNLKHIFQKFYRVDNSQTRTIGGTGLGLYLVKQRVEAMSGRVWVESAFGEGSTFYVSFPRLTPEEYERRRQILANQAMMMTPVGGSLGAGGQVAASATGAGELGSLVTNAVKPQEGGL